jgi:hypothetical protein
LAASVATFAVEEVAGAGTEAEAEAEVEAEVAAEAEMVAEAVAEAGVWVFATGAVSWTVGT